ncbi:SAV_2336 N-terminal domain-related protein [Streptomyces sp. NPDC001634]|uniref:SAV_2336 N-terminal domain-related protein n=1 Tax=Streptomyces sp. NPDC001634 TaxID=3154390 RepID=UPI003332BCF1
MTNPPPEDLPPEDPPPEDPPHSAADGPLNALVERLRGTLGVEPTARELAEALWLAGHVERAEVRTDATDQPPAARQEPPSPGGPEPAPPPRQPGETGGGHPGPTRLYADRTGPGSPAPAADDAFVRVRVPTATALPQPLPLQRALRPLQDHRPPVRARYRRLDEQATAERAAETGLLLPVLRFSTRREARLRLLMDASTSTALWDGMLDELRQICAGLGAFREVSVHYVHEGPDGRPGTSTSRAPGGALRAVEQLRDPTGRQLTLVVSDCAGPLWSSGRMQRLLHHWAQAAPVAVLQPLPQRMWRRTHLPAVPGRLRRLEGLGARLEFRPSDGPGAPGALPVPVLSPTRAALGTWARLLSGSTGLSLPAAAAWVRADHAPAPLRTERPAADPSSLVRTFRRTASPQAVRLAVTFSAVPLALPVMQLVQRAMQPETGPTVLAEVLLGGLLKRGDAEGWYDFAPGVREELLRLLPRGDALLVLKHCGEYVDRHFGRRARNFPALALARLTGGPEPATGAEEVPGAFAEVSELVVGRYGAGAATRATFALVYSAADMEWAQWAADVLRPYGHVRPWTWDLDGPDPGADRPRKAATVVLLLGSWYARDGARMQQVLDEAGVLTGPQERLAVVSVSEDALPWAGRLEPVVPLAGATEPEARRRLLGRLSLDPATYGPQTPGAPFPGRVRRVRYEVPDRDPGFTGPEDVLTRLDQELAGSPAPSPVCAVIGPPGVGKTAVAVEYVHRHAEDYDVVWWVGAQDPRLRRQRLARLATALELLEGGRGVDENIAALRDAARRRPPDSRWLIVFDGWDDLQGADELLISGCQVLITSRDTAWAEAVHAVRMDGADRAQPTRAEAEADVLAWRALVRVDAPLRGRGVTSGSGFFLAPGWVVTAEHLVADRHGLGQEARSTVGVTTTEGRRYQVSQVYEVGGVALLHVPGATDPECLWLSDKPGVAVGEATLYGVTGPLDQPHTTTVRAAVAAARSRDGLVVRDASIPLGAAGGPVVDQRDGAVVGVIKGRSADGSSGGEAVRIGVLRTLCRTPGPRAELWHEIVCAHDRHHADRFRVLGQEQTWTGVQTRLAARSSALGKLQPAARTELYGLLAELPPPESPLVVQDLLGEQGEDRYPACSWRDGVGHLHRGDSADLALVYAARVWARLAEREPPGGRRALADLRAWVTAAVRTTRDAELRRAVEDVFVRLDTALSTSRAVVLVEIERAFAEEFSWRMLWMEDGTELVVAEGTSPTYMRELETRLRPALAEVLADADGEGGPVPVQFELPGELLWALPVERWRVLDADSPLVEQHPVFVRGRDGGNSRLRERRTRWAGLTRGPLESVRTGLDSAPSAAVPVACMHATRVLEEGLARGYPLMLWSRATRHHDYCADFHERVDELLRESVNVRELLALLRHLRASPHERSMFDPWWLDNLAIYYDPPDSL